MRQSAATPAAMTGGTGKPQRAPRTDIQGMRTIAVLAVLIYHVTPSTLTGGFVGVDVFFVISGFLITAHLLVRPPASVADFLGFWGRRIRRLLPASLLVLLTTVIATRLWGPETLWENTARQAGAATLYFVNWLLASDAVDYLAAENAATPVQHYWSLSVEEQFYLVWPVIIALIVWLAIRTRVNRQLALSIGLGAVFVASLLWSVHLTDVEPGAAYFVTPTRMWELAAGGLVALWVPRGIRASAGGRAAVGWLGVALMGYAIVTYDGSTPFPSWTAAVPVAGAALVLAAAAGTESWSPGWWLARRPVQWTGDISYSLYLWHWPLVVLVGARYGGLGWFSGAAVLVLSFALAAITKKFVEDPFRTGSWNRRLAGSYGWGAVAMAIVLAASGALWKNVQNREESAQRQLQAALAANDPCLGAGSLDRALDCGPWTGAVVPTPVQAANDKSDAYGVVSGGKDCWSYEPRYRQVVCAFGVPVKKSTARVTLLGNSHAGQWLPALEAVAADKKWHVSTRLASRCASAGIDLYYPNDAARENCRVWGEKAVDRIIKAKPDLVLMTNRVSQPAVGKTPLTSVPEYQAGYQRILQRFADAQVKVLVLADTPAPSTNGDTLIPDCLAAKGVDSEGCDGPRSEWVSPPVDPVEAAAVAVDSPLIRFDDLNDRICEAELCRAVQGGVIVYFDNSHLTATYARTLAPALYAAIDGSQLLE